MKFIFLFFIFSFLVSCATDIVSYENVTDNFTYTYEEMNLYSIETSEPLYTEMTDIGTMVISVRIFEDVLAEICYHGSKGYGEGCHRAKVVSIGDKWYSLTDSHNVEYIISREYMVIHEPWNTFEIIYHHVKY